MKPKASQDELRKELRGKVEGIVANWRQDPAIIADYLQFAARFPQYSHNNVQLLYAQNPYASFVASASAYKKGLPDKHGEVLSDTPIWIKKGEHAMRIWCPTSQTLVKEPKKGEWKPLSHLTNEQHEAAKAEGWETLERHSFTLVPVFDVSQTELPRELYPKLFGLGEDAPDSEAKINAAKAYASEELKCTVMENADMPGAGLRGAFSRDKNEIKLSALLRGKEKLSTLLHEIGHAELHADPKAAKFSTAQRELEADMYALMLEQRMGLETTNSRKAHLASHYKAYFAEVEAAAEKGKPVELGADSAPFENVIRRYRQQMPVIERYIEIANEAALQASEAREQLSARDAAVQTAPNAPTQQGTASVAVNTFTIYQLKDGDELRNLRFESLDNIQAKGLTVDRSNYELVYTAPLDTVQKSDGLDTLNAIYAKFNVNHPADYSGRSLSISDVVVLQQNGVENAYYCDRYGFKDVPQFLPQQDLQAAMQPPVHTGSGLSF